MDRSEVVALVREEIERSALATRVRQLQPRVVKVDTPASVIDLGRVDGENITGVRISGTGYTTGTGGDTLLRIRPNGLNNIISNVDFHRLVFPAGGPLSQDVVAGGNLVAGTVGLIIASTNWTTASNNLMFDGILYTRIVNRDGVSGHRHWSGTYDNQDLVSNRNSRIHGECHAIWGDAATPVSSLVLALDAGSFVGRVRMEILL